MRRSGVAGFVLGTVLAASLLTAGCAGRPAGLPALAEPSGGGGRTATAVATPTGWPVNPDLPAALRGTWQLTGWDDPAGVPSPPITLIVDGTVEITGDSGCNAYQADLTATASGTVQMGTLGSTYMACLGEPGRVEAHYLDLLSAVDGWHIDGSELVLSKSGTESLRYQRST